MPITQIFPGGIGVTVPQFLPFSPNVVVASRIPGVVLDCDLGTGAKIGGGVATDNSDAFIAVTSVPGNVLLMDGPSLISKCLLLPAAGGGGGIVGIGTIASGFFLKSGSNCDMIHNGAVGANIPSDPGGGVGSIGRGSGVILKNFMLNGNGPNVTKIPAADTFNMGINLMDMEDIVIEDVDIYDCVSYGIRLSNCGTVSVRNYNVISPSRAINTDGLHMNGGCNDVDWNGGYADVGDDPWAVNPPEGRGGDCFNITIRNIILGNCFSAGRIYTTINGTTNFTVSDVLIDNVRGTTFNTGFVLGLAGAGTDYAGNVEGITNVRYTNCTINCTASTGGTAPGFCTQSTNLGHVEFRNCIWDSPVVAASWIGSAGPFSATHIGFHNCKVRRTTAGHADVSFLAGPGTVSNLVIDVCAVEDVPGTAFAPITQFSTKGDYLEHVVINGLDGTKITAFDTHLSAANGVISGPGVLTSGLQFADAFVASGTPYLSSTSSGALSINLAGTTRRINVT